MEGATENIIQALKRRKVMNIKSEVLDSFEQTALELFQQENIRKEGINTVQRYNIKNGLILFITKTIYDTYYMRDIPRSFAVYKICGGQVKKIFFVQKQFIMGSPNINVKLLKVNSAHLKVMFEYLFDLGEFGSGVTIKKKTYKLN